MNFYKHHLGDYDSATSHLSWDEDMAYSRLMRFYYREEKPIPLELPKACRLVRAQSRVQKAAVAMVLEEFFVRAEDGWRNKRCDGEIEQAAQQAAVNRRIAGEREAKRGRPVNGPLNGTHTNRETNRSPVYIGEREPIQTPDSRLREDSERETLSAAGQHGESDPRKTLWKLAVTLLGDDSRSVVGAAIKRVGESKVGEILGAMAVKPPADPKPYFIKATQERGVVI